MKKFAVKSRVGVAAAVATASLIVASSAELSRADALPTTSAVATAPALEIAAVEAAVADKARLRAALKRLIDRAAALDADLRPAARRWFESSPEITAELLSLVAEAPSTTQSAEETTARLRLQTEIANAWVESASSRGVEASTWPVQPDALVAPWLAVAPREPQRAPARSNFRQNRTNAATNAPDAGAAAPAGTARPASAGVPASELLEVAPSAEWRRFLSPASAQAVTLAELDLLADDGQFDQIASPLGAIASPADQDKSIGKVLGFWAIEFGNADSRSDANGNVIRRVLVTAKSTQQANLSRLGTLAESIRIATRRAVPAEPLLDALGAIQGRSTIYELDSLRTVFGPIADLDDATVETLANRARQNLQSAVKSLRQLDPKASAALVEQIARGYDELSALLAEARPDPRKASSRILLVSAASTFDRSEFIRNSQSEDDSWIAIRKASFNTYSEAIDRLVVESNGAVHTPELTNAATEWFARALGASEVASMSDGQVAFAEQLPLIREKFASLHRGEGEQRLLNRLALKLAELGQRVPARAAHAYAQSALQVVGGTPASRVFERRVAYHASILREVSLRVEIDGEPRVRKGEPFGVIVSLVHTRQLDQEVDGFWRILQQTPSRGMLPGTPGAANLRGTGYTDRIAAALQSTLGKRVAIRAITWSDATAALPTGAADGMLVTPLAYALVACDDAAVDRLPPVSIGLDFADRNDAESVQLPLESAPVDLKVGDGAVRPVTLQELSLVFNGREIAAGKATFDVTAAGDGVLPRVEELVSLDQLGDFVIERVAEQPLTLDRFSPVAGLPLRARTSRTWRLSLVAKQPSLGSPSAAPTFRFPVPRVSVAASATPRRFTYGESDVVPAGEVVVVNAAATARDGQSWLVIGGVVGLGAIVIVAVAGMIARDRIRKRRSDGAENIAIANWLSQIPQTPTPVGAVNAIQTLLSSDVELTASQRQALVTHVDELSSLHYARESSSRSSLEAASQSDELRNRLLRLADEVRRA